MSKVDWITWKTNPSEIIKPNNVSEHIQDSFNNYNSYMDIQVYEQIKSEINKGVLGKDTFEVMGQNPANEMAVTIIDKIDEIKEVFERLQKEISKSLEEQKSIEKNQLIDAIEEKKKKEYQLRESILNDDSIKKRIEDGGSSVENVIYIINDRIKKLDERLEIARSL